MADEIVKRLRMATTFLPSKEICLAAADEIERLRAECDHWRKIADGMAGCLDSSCEAGDLLEKYEQTVRGE